MAKVKLGIVAKGLILVAIPLIFEAAFFLTMYDLQRQAQEEAEKAERAREISTLVNNLIHELYAGLQTLHLNVGEFAPGNAHRERVLRAKNQLRRLLELTDSQDEVQRNRDKATLMTVSRALEDGNNLVLRAESAFKRGDEAEELRIRYQAMRFAERLITPELIALGKKHSAISATAPSIQAELRHLTRLELCLALAIITGGTIFLALYTTGKITRRLALLSENSSRIGAGKKLRAPLDGNDEIAELDAMLHKMSREIETLLRREKIIFENARDIICITDRNLDILRISPSVEIFTGKQSEELEGTNCLDLLSGTSTSTRTLNKLKANANSGIATSLEASLSNGKKVLNVLLTMNPTDRDGNLILVMQDITTFKTAERHKSEVVNMVSKDLREPLNQVSDIFEKLEEGKGGSFTQDGTKMLSLARQSTKQMAVLTSDLLELDKIETGQLRLNQTTAASRQLLEKALNLAESIAQTARGGLNPVKIETATAMVFCDQERVIQILMNLIGNALKFSPPGAEIVLSAQKHQQLEDMVVFSVRDHGPGIPEEQKEKIFQRFEQARESDKMIGTGLGLYICQAIVELHGGRIWVENNRDGGSTFYFTLPQERRQLGPAVTKR